MSWGCMRLQRRSVAPGDMKGEGFLVKGGGGMDGIGDVGIGVGIAEGEEG